LININAVDRILSPVDRAIRLNDVCGRVSMHKLIRNMAAVFICSAFGTANLANSAPGAHGGGAGIAHGAGGGGMAHIGGGEGFRGGGFVHGGGGFHGGEFHGRLRGFRGFYGGGVGPYPYSWYGDYYGDYDPYPFYEENYPDCHFVWVKRTVKHKAVQRGIWTCS
jgi:hypothetical protein